MGHAELIANADTSNKSACCYRYVPYLREAWRAPTTSKTDFPLSLHVKRVSGRPGRKGTAQVWARGNLEEGKGSRAQGEEEYGITPGSHRHEREHLWRVVPQVNPHTRSALVKEARTQRAKEPEVESPSEDARVRSGCSSPPRAGGDQKSSSWTMS